VIADELAGLRRVGRFRRMLRHRLGRRLGLFGLRRLGLLRLRLLGLLRLCRVRLGAGGSHPQDQRERGQSEARQEPGVFMLQHLNASWAAHRGGAHPHTRVRHKSFFRFALPRHPGMR